MSETGEFREQPRNQMSLNGIQKAQLVAAVALAALSLNPKVIKASSPYKEPTPLIQPLEQYGPYRSEVERQEAELSYMEAPACYSINVGDTITASPSIESVESKPFDESLLDISSWYDREMKFSDMEIKEDGYTVEVKEESANIIQIPLLESTFIHKKYNDYRPVKHYSVPQGFVYQIIEERTLVGSNGESVSVGLISNKFSYQSASLIILSAKDSNGVEKNFVSEKKNVEQTELDNIIAQTHSISSQYNFDKYEVNGHLSDVLDQLYSPENLTVISEIIKDDNDIQSIIRLSKIFKEYDIKIYDLPKYLKTTPWYQEMIDKHGVEKVDKVLTIPYNVRIVDQPLQCVGFVQMMSKLYPELNILDITGGNTENGAQSLIPPRLYTFWNSEKPGIVPYLNDGIGIGGTPLDLNEYNRGDLFVMTGKTFGHVGLILGKYTVNGEDLLLIADSNKLEDGMVRLYLVNRYNIDNVLGDHRFILRKNDNK